MITKENIKLVLNALNFTVQENIYTKYFEQQDCFLKIDFAAEEIIYPENKGLIINQRQTCNFKANENFVVFECVHRLLEKGYKPESIEIEPQWKSGHGASGGRADIMVRNLEEVSNPMLIIECKTAGLAFDKAWRDTQNTGAQLLTYADRERTVKFVCLYASDWADEILHFNHYIITLSDIPNLVEQYVNKEIKPLFYSAITDVKQWYEVWKNTYNLDYQTNGIFENDVQAYNIGKQKMRLSDLKYITGRDMQGKYNEFAEILRKHNVSSKESAFDKLINLFLCKIVDENQAHHNDKDLNFNWRGNHADDYFSLIDRLQKLYKDGMEEYLGEKITYIDNDKVKAAFGFFRDRNATRDHVLQLFKEQKYFTNSDFGFIDVHNDKLFYQNADILLEVVQMWQNFQLNGEQQNQFLSDMFEGFLDRGFKQSEGQYFTPVPICKFIVSSLPLATIFENNEKPPRVIDYACGSGHFLTEYAKQIKPLIETYNKTIKNETYRKNIKDYYKSIFGVEKEYRLSKVAKMSAFMYGQDEINVIYCDALRNIQQEIHKKIIMVENNSCDILIANPPFSVDRFLTTLTQAERETYTLFNKNVDFDVQRNIQCFFIERAKQLLAPKAVAGIVVPASILSNSTEKLFVATREIILKYFDIVSIVELGNNTFGKTGTNTVILFLRRKENDTDIAIQLKNRSLDFFQQWSIEQNSNGNEYQDADLVEIYCKHIGISFIDYQTLLIAKPSNQLLSANIFKDYYDAFTLSNEVINLKKKKSFELLTAKEQKLELDTRFLKYLQQIESEKLYYFMLAYKNPQKVLIIKSPTDTAAQKEFLGYDWSSSRGHEGIKYYGGNTVFDIITPMFDPQNVLNTDKINFYIQQNFNTNATNHSPVIPSNLQPYISYLNLTDILNFSNKDFTKSFTLTPKTDLAIQTKWKLVKLGELCTILIGGTPSREEKKYFQGENLWVSIAEMKGQVITNTKEKITDEGVKKSNVKLIPKGTTLLSFKLSIGKTAIAGADLYTNEAIAALIPKSKEEITDAYLFHLFSAKFIDLSTSNNAIGQSLNSKYLNFELKIPLPSLKVQQEIVDAMELFEKSKNTLFTENISVKELEKIIQKNKNDIIKRYL